MKEVGRFDGEIRRVLYNICLPFEIASTCCRSPLIRAPARTPPSACAGSTIPPSTRRWTRSREFSFPWQFVSFGVPDQLKGISQEVWEQEREKVAQRMAEASSEIQQVLRQSMADLVTHMAERLKEGPDGKPRKFKSNSSNI